MNLLSRLKIPRPGQLLSMLLGALIVGMVDVLFAPAPTVYPGGMVVISPWALLLHKAFVMWVGATLGLIADMVVFHYARPGSFMGRGGQLIFLVCICRRAFFVVLFAFGMGLAL